MKRKKIRTIIISAIVAVFLIAGICSLEFKSAKPAPSPAPEAAVTSTPTVTPSPIPTPTPAVTAEPTAAPEATPQPTPEVTAAPTHTPVATPEPTPEPAPTPEPTPTPELRNICTIEIRCDTVTDTSKLENEAVIPYIPSGGVILGTVEMEFIPGESVFDILKRVTMDKNIHMEFREDGLYGGAYIEGINYLYEFDAGSLSGWMYKVNGQFPNYGCSRYEVKPGDAIVWMYTCDLGRDVGDNSRW